MAPLVHFYRELELGITLIPAYSPKAWGRSERVFRTMQDRVPKELALAGITDMAAADQYPAEQFLPAYNRRGAVSAIEAGTAFVPWRGSNLGDMLCVQEERVVANDNTVRYQGRRLQIPLDQHRFHDVKVTVWVYEYPDGTLTIFHGSRCLVRYQSDGRVIESGGAEPGRRGPTCGSGDRPIVDSLAMVRENSSARG